ncbi:S26 family signal peptidase [Clostridium folliculivorans]|uniref:Signal peptidase I n=1 Tax=Clostridium folliculivorans TaxID=2886038 RepID=A0A9W5Y5Z1_9CLOT|nr:signal peptidase I [Clostridium folliculivorans]GKU27202.1 S26 family signal peptidase [Clostridium folliculivorans]
MKKVIENIRKMLSNKIVRKVWSYTSNLIIVLLIVLVGLSVYGNVKTKGKDFNAPSIGSYMWMSVLSNSMKPIFSSGDLIIDRKVDVKDLKVGDIVTFRWNTSLSTHRIVEIIKDGKGNVSYKTKGDNNNAVDQEAVNSVNVVGKYAFKIPLIGYILTELKGLAGIILIWILFFGVTGTEIYLRMKKSKEKKIEDVKVNS